MPDRSADVARMKRASGLAARAVLAAIRGYQRWLSPYKGFSCALRVATGGASCSTYGHAVIARFGLRRGLGLLDRRLALCGHVHRTARAMPPAHPLLKHQRGFCDAACDVPSCDLPCHGGGCMPSDALGDLVCCACDAGDCWRSRNERRPTETFNRVRSSTQLEALAQRIKRQRQRVEARTPRGAE